MPTRPTPRTPILVAILTAAALSLACDRNLAPFDPEAEPREPDLSRIFPAPQPAEGQGAEPQEELAAGDGPVRTAPSGSIRGEISVDASVADSVPGDATLFIIARAAGARGGPPLAVRRMPAPEFPLAFEIGQEQVMIPGVRFEGEIQLTARLDSDGNAMTRLPGDLQGTASAPVAPGSDGVAIVLSERL